MAEDFCQLIKLYCDISVFRSLAMVPLIHVLVALHVREAFCQHIKLYNNTKKAIERLKPQTPNIYMIAI